VARFEALDAGGGRPSRVRLYGRSRDGVYGARDGVDAVEGSGEDERVVGSEVLQAGGEGAVVDLQSEDFGLALCRGYYIGCVSFGISYKSAGFIDYQKGEDNPAMC
jgi:hypothetical protein